MDLINKKVKIINKEIPQYNMIGFCRGHRGPDLYIVELLDGVYTFLKEEIIPLEISKSLLKSGDLIIDKNGNKYRIFLDYEDKRCKGVLVNEGGFLPINDYEEDLTLHSPYGIFDIEKIYTPKMPLDYLTDDLARYDLKWSRKKTKEMTIEEIEDALGLTEKGIELIILKGEKEHE